MRALTLELWLFGSSGWKNRKFVHCLLRLKKAVLLSLPSLVVANEEHLEPLEAISRFHTQVCSAHTLSHPHSHTHTLDLVQVELLTAVRAITMLMQFHQCSARHRANKLRPPVRPLVFDTDPGNLPNEQPSKPSTPSSGRPK